MQLSLRFTFVLRSISKCLQNLINNITELACSKNIMAKYCIILTQNKANYAANIPLKTTVYQTIRENKINKVPNTSRNLLFSLNNLHQSSKIKEKITCRTRLIKKRQIEMTDKKQLHNNVRGQCQKRIH